MTTEQLALRLTDLELEVARLKEQRALPPAGQPAHWWHDIAGRYDGDHIFAQIAKGGRVWRRATRRELRSIKPKAKRARS
jgi:hypothetical protein